MRIKLMEGKALAKLIGEIGTARVKLDEQVQLAAVHCIGQSIVHRNTTPANSLLDAVSKHHKATLVAYLEKFGNFEWDRKGETLKFREQYGVDGFEAALEAIGESKWYDAKKPPKVVSQYDAVEVLSNQFERLFKAKAKGITIANMPVLEAVHAAYCAAVAKAYDEGQLSDEQIAIDEALKARAVGKATPQQLEQLSKHYGRQVTQVGANPAAESEFGGTPTLATGTDGK